LRLLATKLFEFGVLPLLSFGRLLMGLACFGR
jgi:hypothetical protein